MKTFCGGVLFLLLLLPLHSYGASGDVDPSFSASAFGGPNGTVNVIRRQPDGKLLIGGVMQDVNGHTASGLARLNLDGSVDTSFVPPDFYVDFTIGLTIRAIAVQPDGKILVGGEYWGVDGVQRPGVRRLNPDGSIDPTWPVPPDTPINYLVHDIEVQPDGKVIIASHDRVIRHNADGTVDSSFVIVTHSFGRAFDVELQPDGKMLLGGDSLIRRNADGSIDDTFTPVNVGGVTSVTRLADGRILVTGTFFTVNSFAQRGIARINPNGSLDLTFNQNNPGSNGDINDAAVRSDGKILIGGTFTMFNSTARQKVARLNADGTLDLTFQNNATLGGLTPTDIEPVADDKVIIAASNVSASLSALTRLNADGSTDNSISWLVSQGCRVRKVVTQPDGKVLIGGNFRFVNGEKRQGLARLNLDGSLDASFVPYFNDLTPSPNITSIVLQPDGKILITTTTGLVLRRLFSNGAQDTSFSPNLRADSVAYDLALRSDGHVIAVGLIVQNTTGANGRVLKFSPTGVIDTAWAATSQPNALPYRVLLQPDGKALIGGDFTQIGSATLRGRIARLGVNGDLDATFNPPGGANSSVYNIALQADGKVLIAGAFYGLNGSFDQKYVGRLNGDGTLDTSFAQQANFPVVGLYVQPDGKILIGGRFSLVGGVARRGIARLNSNGAFDHSFTAVANYDVLDFVVQGDGKIVAGGEFTKINGTSHVRVARMLNPAAAPRTAFDFDGDGRADISVTRPGALYTWYQLRGATYTYVEFNFGQSGDIVAPADFDGDGKTDAAIFRPSNGQWWYLSSVDGTQRSDTFGASGDIPRPSDYTGDGKADFVLYRPSTGVWQRLANGTSSSSNIAFGAPGDKPLVADFDGDGKADPSIFRPSTGEFWYAASSQGNAQRAFQWGTGTDIPTPADYDGDGKTDFAIYRPSTGVWWIFKSGTSTVMNLTWGVAEDKPIPADYDGDGKADTGLFRPSTGTWYLLNSTSGFSGFQWGTSTDVPSPGAFVP